MITINDIESVNWQMGIAGPGEVVQSLADIRQCIGLIIVTSKGSDPLRPTFGTDIYKLIDQPVNIAAPKIVAEILQGIQLWEPRVKVTSLVYTLDYEKIHFELNLLLLLNGESAQVLFEIDRLTSGKAPTAPYTRAFGRGFSFAFA